MKKYILSLLVAVGMIGMAQAYSVGEFLGDLDKQVSFTAFDTLSTAYFYNGVNGRSEVGVISHAITFCKYFGGDVGYSTGYDGKTTGAFKYGVSLDAGKVLSDSFPETVGMFKAFIPGPANKILNALFIGPYVSRNTENQDIEGGFYTGLQIHW